MKEQGERPALRPRAVRPPGHRRGRRPGAPAGRVRHRHRHRRRDEQGELPRLREGPPRRVRGRHGRSHGWRRRGRRRSTTSPSTTRSTSRSTRRRSRPLRRIICKGPISYVGQELLQTDIDNLKAATARLRRGRRLHAVDRAERVRAQRVLRHPRGVPPRGRRGDARGVPRRSSPPASSCRSTTRS